MSKGWMTLLALILGANLPAMAQAPATPAAAPSAPVVAVPAVTDPDYMIGPGDTLQVFVWRNPELSVTVPVRPDGKMETLVEYPYDFVLPMKNWKKK
jgi:polysaccharide export outer membrane protein